MQFSSASAARFAVSTSVSKEADLRSKFEAYTRASTQNRRNAVSWQEVTIPRLLRFVDYLPGWDGHGSAQVSSHVAIFALRVLDTIMTPETENPTVVPSSCGGVQIEWHTRSIDLEILITAPHAVQVYYRNKNEGEERDFDVEEDLTKVQALLDHLR